MKLDTLTSGYGRFIGEHPFRMILIVIMISAAAQYGNSIIEQAIQDNSDMIPATYDAIWAMNVIGDEFGGVQSGSIVIELEPSEKNSIEARDVREPEVIAYALLLADKAERLTSVVSARSPADIVMQDGRVPQSKRTIINKLKDNPQSGSYVSEDYSMAIIRLDFIDGLKAEEVYDDLSQIVSSTPAPSGVKATPNGGFAVETAMQRGMGPDMSRTSQMSMIGILFVIIMLFKSIRYGLTSLTAIIFGVMWTFGLMGLLGWEVTNVTSGGASMIMGIGIDFGIQVTSRFRLELKKSRIAKAMAETVRVVALPMGTTTTAALIGFQAMSMGELKVLSELGRMMSLGVLCCMISAMTIVTLMLVLGEKYIAKKK
ncbi:MMPL family transporter [Candidatus Altiarchaeota archaeon]